MTTSNEHILQKGSRARKVLAVSATALLTALAVAVPTWASPTGPDSIRPGKNIGVFHNLDFIAAFGYPEGEKLTIDVYRGDTRIATASGPAGFADEGLPLSGALEVNHGIDVGTAGPGDCWTNYTPDVLPGDRVVVTDASGGTDQVFVDDIAIAGPPQLNDATPDDPNDIILQGHASFVSGNGTRTPIPVERLDSGDLRLGSDYRATPDDVVRTPGTEDGWTATYRQDADGDYNWYKNPSGLDPDDQKQAILAGDHAMGYGHVAPLPPETQLVEGLGGGGPALGCENLAPAAGGNAMSVVSDDSINRADVENNANVEVSGVIEDGVDVALTRTDGQNNAADVPVTQNANGTWTATIPASDFAEGNNTLTASFSGLVTKTQTENVAKDTTPPGLATASPAERLHRGNVNVTLNAPAGESGAQIRYTVGTGDFAAPTATSGSVYNGQILLTSSQTIKAIVIDAAGNPGEVAEFAYTIDRDAPGISASLLPGAYDTPRVVALESEDPDAAIFYTTNGDTPNKDSNRYVGQIPVNSSMTLKAVAIDPAGNLSPVLSRTYTIRAATSTSLSVPRSALKLGKSRTISGVVSPVQPGGRVTLTIRKPGADLVRTLTLRGSRYSFTYRPPAVGRYSVQASFAKDADSLASKSATRSFKVFR